MSNDIFILIGTCLLVSVYLVLIQHVVLTKRAKVAANVDKFLSSEAPEDMKKNIFIAFELSIESFFLPKILYVLFTTSRNELRSIKGDMDASKEARAKVSTDIQDEYTRLINKCTALSLLRSPITNCLSMILVTIIMFAKIVTDRFGNLGNIDREFESVQRNFYSRHGH